jgi:hypothetical protein
MRVFGAGLAAGVIAAVVAVRLTASLIADLLFGPHYLHAPRRAGLLSGYACLSERDIRDGVALLSTVLRGFFKNTRRPAAATAVPRYSGRS